MIKINWDEYKEFKGYSNKDDKFNILLDFMKSYYNMHNMLDVYEVLVNDELANMMLEKREIVDAEALEKYMFKV